MDSPLEPQAEELEKVTAELVPEGEAISQPLDPQYYGMTAEELEAMGCTLEELLVFTDVLNASHELTRRDLLLLFDQHQMPAEGEMYGPWTPQMRRILNTAKTKGYEAAYKLFAEALRDQEPWAVIFINWGKALKDSDWMKLIGVVPKKPDGNEWLDEFDRWMHASEEERCLMEARETEAQLGERIADTILAELKKHDCSRADLYARFGRSVSAEQLDKALFTLHRQSRISVKVSSSGGRPREMWMLRGKE